MRLMACFCECFIWPAAATCGYRLSRTASPIRWTSRSCLWANIRGCNTAQESLPPDVYYLLHLGNDFHLDQKCRVIFLLRRELVANLVELRIGQTKLGLHLSFPGFAEADAGSLVPYDVIAAEIFHQHQHVERVGHGVERAAIVRANVVLVPPAQLHLHIHDPVGTPAHTNSSAEKRWPDVDPAKHQLLDFSVHRQRSPASCQTRRMSSGFNVFDHWAERCKARRALDCRTASRLPNWR